jgi:hypothetical protein
MAGAWLPPSAISLRHWTRFLRLPTPIPAQVKFLYDHVFDPLADNTTVYRSVASPIVQSALDGINGTIFACALPPPLQSSRRCWPAAARGHVAWQCHVKALPVAAQNLMPLSDRPLPARLPSP